MATRIISFLKDLFTTLFPSRERQQKEASERARVVFEGYSPAITEKVLLLLIEQLGVDMEQLSPSTTFIDDLGADELDGTELVMAIEEEFGIEMIEEEAEKIITIGDLLVFLSKKGK